MAVPVRSDDVVALMFPAWGQLLGHSHGDREIPKESAKHFRREVRDVFAQLAKGGAPVTADMMKNAVEGFIREKLAPFENKVPTEAELKKLPPLIRERLEDYQRVRLEAHLRHLAAVDPFPDGVVDHKYFDHHLQLKTLELGEKLIKDYDLIDVAADVAKNLKGKKERTLPDGTKVKVVQKPEDMFGRAVFFGNDPALQITSPDGSKLLVQASRGRIELVSDGLHRTNYMSESPGEAFARLGGGKRERLGRHYELTQRFSLGGVNIDALGQLAVTLDAIRNGGKKGAKIEARVQAHHDEGVALWGQYMVRAEWPAKFLDVAEKLANGRAMKLENDRTRLSIKDKVEITNRDDEKLTIAAEPGGYIHVRESHGNRDFAVSIAALKEGRLDLVLVGDRREPERVEVAKDGTMKRLDLALPALGNLEWDLELAWNKVKGIKVGPWKDG